MSSVPKFYIERSKTISYHCKGCTHVTELIFGGDIGRKICARYPCPDEQFIFARCRDFYPSASIRELISLIENIILKKN